MLAWRDWLVSYYGGTLYLNYSPEALPITYKHTGLDIDRLKKVTGIQDIQTVPWSLEGEWGGYICLINRIVNSAHAKDIHSIPRVQSRIEYVKQVLSHELGKRPSLTTNGKIVAQYLYSLYTAQITYRDYADPFYRSSVNIARLTAHYQMKGYTHGKSYQYAIRNYDLDNESDSLTTDQKAILEQLRERYQDSLEG